MILQKHPFLADLLLFIVAVVWGVGFPITHIALQEGFTPYTLITLRFLIASLVLVALVFIKKIKFSKRDLWQSSIVGIFLFLAFLTQTVGILYTTPSKNAFLTSVNVIIVPFIYWLITKKKADTYTLVASFICVLGIGFLTLSEKFTLNKGDTLSLICAFFYACHIVSVAYFGKGINSLVLSAFQMLTTAILAGITLLFVGAPFHQVTTLGYLSSIYLGIISTLIAFFLQTLCQKYTTASKAAIILSTEALFGTMASIFFIGEVLTFKIFIGGLAIFTAVIIAETKLEFLKKKSKVTV